MDHSDLPPEEEERRRLQFLGETQKALQSAYLTGVGSLPPGDLNELQRMITWCAAKINET